MIPIVFCASFVPCVNATNPPDTSWRRRKTRLTFVGDALRDDPRDAEDQREREGDAEERRDDRRDQHLVQDPVPLDDVLARRRHRRPDHAADQGVARARRQADEPGDEVPRDRPDEPGHHDVERDRLRVDDPLGDGRGDRDRDERAQRSSAPPRSRPRGAGRARRVETLVAIEFAVSWNPFVKSKKSATTTTATSVALHGSRLRRSSRRCSRSCSRPSHSVERALEPLVDVLPPDHHQRVDPVVAEQRRERLAEDAVPLVLEPLELDQCLLHAREALQVVARDLELLVGPDDQARLLDGVLASAGRSRRGRADRRLPRARRRCRRARSRA